MSFKRKNYHTSSSHSAKRHSMEKSKRPPLIENCKLELRSYLHEYANITDQDDFWRFYDKYKVMGSKTSNEERSKILNIDFVKDWKMLYDRLPVINIDEQWVSIDKSDFRQFLTIIKVYQDFQQKTSFNKLKKLKMTQLDLPIAKHKAEIIENVHNHKVTLIAGKILDGFYIL